MMRRPMAVAAGFLLASGSANAAPFTFLCTAPLGHGSQLSQVQPGPTYRLRGRMSPIRLEPIPDPSLPLRVEGNDIPDSQRSADISIVNSRSNASVSLIIMPRFSGDEPESVADIVIQTGVDGEYRDHRLATLRSHGFIWDYLTFDIEVREDRVIVDAGGSREEIPVVLGPEAAVEFACIGGSFDFEAIDWDGDE